MVDDQGEQMGVIPIQDALAAANERGLDLVEVAPSADPPVCRLMDYGKFRYQASRKEREARKAQKGKPTNMLREVRFKVRIGAHDKSSKTRGVRRLLEEGSKVKVSVMFRGREITHPELGMRLLRSVAEDLVDDALLEKPPTMEGRFLSMILAPNPTKPSKASDSEAQVAEKEPVASEAVAVEPEKELDRAKA